MALRKLEEARIENPRGYTLHSVEGLRKLLVVRGPGRRDPNREHFYELEGNNESFYIHISPITGNVILLAKWSRQTHQSCLDAEHLVA